MNKLNNTIRNFAILNISIMHSLLKFGIHEGNHQQTLQSATCNDENSKDKYN